jgi:hypothetical protein
MKHYFENQTNKFYAWASDEGLQIENGWTVGIPVSTALEYAKKYNQMQPMGFHEVSEKNGDNKVTLAHSAAMLEMDKEDALAIVTLIKSAYS